MADLRKAARGRECQVRITPPSGKPTGDRARGPMSPAELNKINAEFWKRNK
ncbi:hypothetical protein U9Z84_02740 [Escherichia coli]